MRDGVDFARDVARFSEAEAAYLVDVLQEIFDARGKSDDTFEELIRALDECDCIEIVSDAD